MYKSLVKIFFISFLAAGNTNAYANVSAERTLAWIKDKISKYQEATIKNEDYYYRYHSISLSADKCKFFMERQFIDEGEVDQIAELTFDLQSFKAITSRHLKKEMPEDSDSGPEIFIKSHAKNVQYKFLVSDDLPKGTVHYSDDIHINFDYEIEANIVKRMEKAFMNLKQIAEQNCQGSDEAF
ncbi:hypothetical protein [Pseudoalteromonas pernae]|uniref:hypothetical protein n=1 Tax=Pseudoalteromonas pernae TaxID=3118054 RepID=UPI0032425F7A